MPNAQSNREYAALYHCRACFNDKILNLLRRPFNTRDPKQLEIMNPMILKVREMAKTGESDADIYTYIHTYLNDEFYSQFGWPENEGVGRSNVRARHIYDLIKNEKKPSRILDVGCSHGSIIVSLGEMFGIKDRENLIGTDIMDESKIEHREKFTYFQTGKDNMDYQKQPEIHIPLESDSVDLTTVMMVLHHIPKPLEMIREIGRVLKVGGSVVIREHDIDSTKNECEKMYLDVLHGMYNMVWSRIGEEENPDHITNYFARYRRKETWDKMFADCGMERVKTPDVNKKYYEAKYNWIYAYFAVYKKI